MLRGLTQNHKKAVGVLFNRFKQRMAAEKLKLASLFSTLQQAVLFQRSFELKLAVDKLKQNNKICAENLNRCKLKISRVICKLEFQNHFNDLKALQKHFNVWQRLLIKDDLDCALPRLILDTPTKSTPDFSTIDPDKFQFENEGVADEQATWSNYSIYK